MLNIIKDQRFKNVLKFSVAYRFIMQLLITPFLLYLGKTLLNYHQVQFMSTDTLLFLLTKPSVWLFIIVGLGILMFLLMIELSSVIVLSEYKDAQDSLLPFSLNKVAWTLRPKNLVYLPLLMMVLLGFHFGMSSMITDTLFIPEFIMDTIVKTPMYMFLYTGVTIVAFVIAFHLVFLFHNLFIAEKKPLDAARSSVGMVRGHRVSFVVDALKLGIQVSVVSGLFYFIFLFISAFIIYLVPPFFSMNAVSLSVLFIINRVLVFFVLNAISAVNVLFLTNKYHDYGGELPLHHPVEDNRMHKKHSSPKYILVTMMVFTLILQGFGAYKTSQSFDTPEFLDHKIYITSHRGNSSVAPENTISAIKAAKKERADAAEIDVQLTTDGKVVVIHDFTLSRLANDPRRVIDLSLEELKELEVGSWFSREFAGEKIPTLEEVIEESGNEIMLNIELKPTNDEAKLAKAVVEILEDSKYSDHVIISSLSKKALLETKKLNEDLNVGFIIPVALGSFDFDEDIDFYSLEMSFVTKSLVEKLKNQDKELHVWTVNSEEDMKKMQRLQVDNIITDHPVLAKKVLSTNLLEKGILSILSLFEL